MAGQTPAQSMRATEQQPPLTTMLQPLSMAQGRWNVLEQRALQQVSVAPVRPQCAQRTLVLRFTRARTPYCKSGTWGQGRGTGVQRG